MADLANFPQRVRFGAFEVDLRAGEVWKAGRKRKLTGQPFSVLAILLERPGEVVSREELQKRLWPDTFVDVDHNLNTAINKIREALDDPSERPRFVETLPRRGYRFIAPVESVEPAPATTSNGAAVASGPTSDPAALTAPLPPLPAAQPLPAPITASKLPTRARAAAWSLAVVAALILAYLLRPTMPPPQVTGTTQLTRDGAQKLGFEGDIPLPLVTDGSRIYFENFDFEHGAIQTTLMQVSTEGGEAEPTKTSLEFDGIADVVPNRPELLVGGPPHSSETPQAPYGTVGLWLLPVPGGQPRRVGNLVVNDATLSPDGTAIFYSSGTGVFTAKSDGSEPRKILTTNGTPFWLRFSPDGSVLRFSVLFTNSLWEVRPDGTHLRQLFAGWNNSTTQCCGNWTSDGKYFIFESTHQGISTLWATREKPDLWRKVNREPMQLTVGEINAEAPVASRDGKKVFFIGSTRRGELVGYDQKRRAFMPYLSGLSAEGVTFTRDGQRMAYVSYPDGILWQSKLDGSDRHGLTFSPMEVGLPQWSPDGKQIAFSGLEPGKSWQIFVVGSEGGEPEQLTSGDLSALDPTWSPDGSSLAFGEDVFSVGSPQENAIHILDLKTRQVTALLDSATLFSPRWSPDGRYLVAARRDYTKIVLYDFTQQKWADLVRMPGGWLNWSQDGKCIYFVQLTDKTEPVYRICLNDRKLEHIGNVSDAGNLALGPFGWWTGIDPDGSILATRDTSIEEIYALDVKFP